MHALEVVVRLVDEDDRVAGAAAMTARMSASLTGRPLGLCGVLMKMRRVFGEMAASTLASGKAKSASDGIAIVRAPRALALMM